MTCVYKITNTANGKFYVGSTVNSKARFRTHRRELTNGVHHCEPLQRAWVKYGAGSFSFDVIEVCASSEAMHEAENVWLEAHHGTRNCYNTGTRAGAAFLGKTHTLETKAKLSALSIGKQHRLGQINSLEHRARQSAGMKGIKKSPEHVEKIRQRMIGTSYSKGRVVTEETRALLGRPVIELTTGLTFISVVSAAAHFGIDRPNVVRALRWDRPLKRGPHAGLHFQNLAPIPLAC